jgi:hypothetical protein
VLMSMVGRVATVPPGRKLVRGSVVPPSRPGPAHPARGAASWNPGEGVVGREIEGGPGQACTGFGERGPVEVSAQFEVTDGAM